jgi:hypothetical protein
LPPWAAAMTAALIPMNVSVVIARSRSGPRIVMHIVAPFAVHRSPFGHTYKAVYGSRAKSRLDVYFLPKGACFMLT